jgi:hypothetical protein
MFEIETERRPMIESVSAFPEEREVLFAAGSFFTVIDVKERGAVTWIYLRDVYYSPEYARPATKREWKAQLARLSGAMGMDVDDEDDAMMDMLLGAVGMGGDTISASQRREMVSCRDSRRSGRRTPGFRSPRGRRHLESRRRGRPLPCRQR